MLGVRRSSEIHFQRTTTLTQLQCSDVGLRARAGLVVAGCAESGYLPDCPSCAVKTWPAGAKKVRHVTPTSFWNWQTNET
jgi:hypothetical protein